MRCNEVTFLMLCTFEGSMGFSLAEVTDAQRLIAGLARVTPLIEAQSFSRQAGQPILLKLETLQPIGAFKFRGAAHALLRLDPEARRSGDVCCSSGNYGTAIATTERF